MSAVQTLEGMRELASSLAQDDIPVKLRCATCNKLVISAFRLPCCDQSICETCQTSLPESCPVCDHSPLSAEDCKPNKSLRLTVKAFLKAEEKKRDKDRGTPQAKHTDTSVPNTADATSTHPSQHNPAPGEDVPGKSIEEEALTNGEDISANIKNVADVREDGGSALSKGRREEPEAAASTKQVSTNEEEQSIEDSSAGGGESKRTEEANEDTTAEEQKNSWSMNAGTTQQIQGNNTAFGMSTAQGGFSNMGWNGTNGFNPMMQMGASMPSAGWNNFNMMGMPGMGMDAMAMSQGMFGGFGGQNMGMNGMNGMNMGMGFGGGFNSGWNGQMSSGDFGANAGYYPGSGYNQQSHQQSNYAHQMHHQQFPKNNYQNRFNGQGGPQTRGFGRGQTGNYGNQSNSDAQAQIADIPQGQTTTDANSKHDGNMDHQTSRSVEPSQSATVLGDSEKQHDERQDQDETQPAGDTNRVDDSTVEVGNGEPTTNDDPAPVQQDEQSAAVDVAQNVPVSEDPAGQMQVQQDQPIATYEGGADSYGMDVSVMPMAGHLDANGAYSYIQGHQGGHMPEFSTGGRGGARGYYRGGFANRGGRYMANGSYGQHNASLAVSNGDVTVLAGGTEPPGVGVVGAPTGPKAMRVGLPNTGISGRIAASSNNRSASMSGSIEPPRERDRR
ncbi:hypothetical protein EJ05DRAFT_34291 [Pseudovirgaria hyperparasitica]|uniref:RING-type domain-containing protein n=1 Tax=Pseudovirgaria hyperparasitica TaxID=470096 RepID=A0A6A6WM99_9PEZI|nr:uncharacterized protein EJ05DRAFT_34291 [Pseudovirgaria hyperparasitica]KAF2763331.1 hypothetical protein EJ05DRAFT_34291 [Pseudovirgaria hyperparasitica]